MSTPSSDGLREVKLRYGIRRLGLKCGTDDPPSSPWHEELEELEAQCALLNKCYPTVLHTVEEVELNPED